MCVERIERPASIGLRALDSLLLDAGQWVNRLPNFDGSTACNRDACSIQRAQRFRGINLKARLNILSLALSRALWCCLCCTHVILLGVEPPLKSLIEVLKSVVISTLSSKKSNRLWAQDTLDTARKSPVWKSKFQVISCVLVTKGNTEDLDVSILLRSFCRQLRDA